MGFPSWLRNYLRPNSGERRRGHGPAPRRATVRPRVELLEGRLAPATFLVTNTRDGDPGSLREAIHMANATPGADTIKFNIPIDRGPPVIVLRSALPTVTGPVTIDGDTQPGSRPGVPVVEVTGAGTGGAANGLVLKAPGCVVRGLILDHFGG